MMTAHCNGCIYCRPLGSTRSTVCCHYYLDTGNKLPCPGGDGCTAKRVLGEEEAKRYLAAVRANPPIRAQSTHKDVHDDYIYDSRGALDGCYPKGGEWM